MKYKSIDCANDGADGDLSYDSSTAIILLLLFLTFSMELLNLSICKLSIS